RDRCVRIHLDGIEDGRSNDEQSPLLSLLGDFLVVVRTGCFRRPMRTQGRRSSSPKRHLKAHLFGKPDKCKSHQLFSSKLECQLCSTMLLVCSENRTAGSIGTRLSTK